MNIINLINPINPPSPDVTISIDHNVMASNFYEKLTSKPEHRIIIRLTDS